MNRTTKLFRANGLHTAESATGTSALSNLENRMRPNSPKGVSVGMQRKKPRLTPKRRTPLLSFDSALVRLNVPSTIMLVMTTVGALEDAQRVGRAAIERRVAACVQVNEIQSIYRWD
ncbi:MAG: divalent cation tolerance protein CutA, partial [Planctomycetales bacterium]|nr:divalent cation tolerance protein CutA [Planctomycetales bacterium]